MSIPFFFEAVKLIKNYFVDGGILSNFPVWLFDSDGVPEWPTFGFKFIDPDEGRPNDTSSPIALGKAIISTMMEAHDNLQVESEDFLRTIAIPTMGVRTTEFDLSQQKRDALYNSGVQAAKNFLKTWDFSGYIQKYRLSRNSNYVQKIKKLNNSTLGYDTPLPGA